jgi:hypothetical protein
VAAVVMAVITLVLILLQPLELQTQAEVVVVGLQATQLVAQVAPASSLFAGLQTLRLLQAQQATHRFFTITDTRFISGLHQALLLFKE